MNKYIKTLREHNLKATPQRLAILESVHKHGHINIDNLYDEIKDLFSSISLATIYKNINSMTKELLLFEVKLPNKKSVYEITKGKHAHLLCNKCSNVIDVKIDINKPIEVAASENHFKVVQSDLVLSGICKHCI